MFEPDLYRKACSEGMRLSGEKIEEMIFMTENKKRALGKPMQIGLIAAALAVVMCVTAAAANPEAVQKLWESLAMSVVTVRDDGDTMIVQVEMPEISVERVDGRVILTVDGIQADITEALDRDGEYKQTLGSGDTAAELTVNADLTWGISLPMEDGSGRVFGIGGDGEANVTYTFTDDENVPNATYLPPEE